MKEKLLKASLALAGATVVSAVVDVVRLKYYEKKYEKIAVAAELDDVEKFFSDELNTPDFTETKKERRN